MLLLREVARADMRGARLTELAERCEVGTATAHRMLKCLAGDGLLDKDENNRYRLGKRLYELGLLAGRQFDLDALVGPHVRRLAETTGDTVFLALRSGIEIVCVNRHLGSYPVTVLTMGPGTRRPMGAGASGVALLAALPPEEADAIIAANAPYYLPFVPEGAACIRRWVRAARQSGIAATQSFVAPGVGALGIVVPSRGAVNALALSIVAIADRVRPPRYAEVISALRAAARDIAAAVDSTPRP